MNDVETLVKELSTDVRDIQDWKIKFEEDSRNRWERQNEHNQKSNEQKQKIFEEIQGYVLKLQTVNIKIAEILLQLKFIKWVGITIATTAIAIFIKMFVN